LHSLSRSRRIAQLPHPAPTAAPRARPRRIQARAVATRRRLLGAAEELFGRKGYESTSMSEVAERAEVGVGTLYHHFPDKRALLLALIDDWGDRELEQSRAEHDFARYLEGSPHQAIRSDLRRRYERLRRDGGFGLLVLQLADRDSDVRQRLHRIRQVGRERLRQLIAYGQRRGVFRSEIDPHAAAFLIQNAINMAATEVLVHEHEELAPDSMLEELTRMIARYVLEDPR
jgi:AcrR family transcriptional regulator